MVIFILSVLGLAFGSFVNALVWRMKQGMSVASGRSMCTHCRHTLAWYDLIPVLSWVALGGRCRYCKQTISWQYPLVELAMAGLFVLSYEMWPRELNGANEWTYFGVWLVSLIIMLALVVYDLRWLILPDRLNWLFVLAGVVSIVILSVNGVDFVKDHLLGMAVASGFFALLYYGSGGRWLGGGDVKYALGMGAWLGVSRSLVGILVAFYSASVVIIPLLLAKVVKRKQPVPFGPFLIIGTIVAMLYGQNIIDWYQSTFLLGAF